MIKRKTGDFIVVSTIGEEVKAFLPHPLPPDPPIRFENKLNVLIERATLALGRLDGLTRLLPDSSIFLYFYGRKEALLSSQIEGTQSSFSDLILFEMGNDTALGASTEEVAQHVAAMNHGLQRLRDGFPLSLRLLREIHGILLHSGRGSTMTPGEFRTSQNWIGGTRPGNALFVPPPHEMLGECLGQLEKFLHSDTPALLKAALAHVQFETIHPFLDGNGRLGRLLITFLLCAEKVLNEPLLYLSLFFKTHRSTYYDLLQSIRINGNWEDWLEFFLTGVKETADQAVSTAENLLHLFEKDDRIIKDSGRVTGSLLQLHNLFKKKLIVSTRTAYADLDLGPPTILKALKRLETLGIVEEITRRRRGLIYTYSAYLDILKEGTEL
ncbi:MAG: Fic family protein [Candidatus Marinimicrobia bacterium]|nr:Fic family protein [Candidatus Neomarinimicrobiota bacterium]